MHPNQTENTAEIKTEQVNIPQTTQPVVNAQANEPAPVIKSEENQANWKAFREQREAERKSREYSEKMAAEKAREAEALRAALDALTSKPSSNQQMNNYDSQNSEETEDQKIDRRVEAIIKEREAKAEQERKQKEQQEFPQKIVQTFPDFNKVCSSENLDYLEYHYPEVAAPFKYMPEGYDKWASVYKAVKRFIPNQDARIDAQKVEKNLAKPGSISSPGTSQGSGHMAAPKLDEARKASNWERMQKVLKGLS